MWKTVGAGLLTISFSAHAGVYGDDLAKCLVESTTPSDRALLVKWLFAAASAHPAVASIVNVSPTIMQQTNASMGAMLMRLLTVACKDKAKKAIEYEGPGTIQLSFEVLGKVAGRELFASPEVAKGLSGLESNLDKKKLEGLGLGGPPR